MQNNLDKCEVIHFGSKNEADYSLNGCKLGEGSVQRVLGVLVHQSLKVSMQVQQAVKKANDMLAFIARGFVYRSRDVLLQVYRALVRPHLEYCVQLKPGCSCSRGSAAKVYQADSGDGGTEV